MLFIEDIEATASAAVDQIEPRQDDKGEKALAGLFGLERNTSRMADEDALDEHGRPYQLKASTKSGISTVRNFGPANIDKFRRVYIIVAWGRNYADRFEVDQTFFLSRCHIDPWLVEKQAHFDREIEEANQVLLACRGFDPVRLSRLKKRLHNGMLLNDPNIPKSYILGHGIPIEYSHPEMLRQLVREYPLDREPEVFEYADIFI